MFVSHLTENACTALVALFKLFILSTRLLSPKNLLNCWVGFLRSFLGDDCLEFGPNFFMSCIEFPIYTIQQNFWPIDVNAGPWIDNFFQFRKIPVFLYIISSIKNHRRSFFVWFSPLLCLSVLKSQYSAFSHELKFQKSYRCICI